MHWRYARHAVAGVGGCLQAHGFLRHIVLLVALACPPLISLARPLVRLQMGLSMAPETATALWESVRSLAGTLNYHPIGQAQVFHIAPDNRPYISSVLDHTTTALLLSSPVVADASFTVDGYAQVRTPSVHCASGHRRLTPWCLGNSTT